MDTKLSLERPYKNDEGLPIPVLQDITQQGDLVYESKVTQSQALSENLRRLFSERGTDFFERNKDGFLEKHVLTSQKSQDEENSDSGSETSDDDDQLTVKPMTTEELFKMKTEVLPSLYIALGEMQHASLLLSTILSTSPAAGPSQIPIHPTEPQEAPPSTLATTTVSKPPQIVSVQAFNAQLAIGGKDEALRKAAGLFKNATERMEKGRIRNERYWVDALKIRRANWSLVPAPLPFGSAIGRGADKTAKDFVISYGLEESPANFRRNAIAHMTYGDGSAGNLVFPHRLSTRLRVSLTKIDADGTRTLVHSSGDAQVDDGKSLDEILKSAKREIIEQEIFAVVAQEAGTFPTASSRVSERLIVIEAAQGTELKFELLDADFVSASSSDETKALHQAKCDLIYHYLFALLLRKHSYQKSQRHRLAPQPRNAPQSSPTVLRPIIDLIQYEVFCERIKSQLDAVTTSLSAAGIKSILRFKPVGEAGKELITIPIDESDRGIGGESLLRIDNRHTVRLTMLSPSSLTAHLPQARIAISSIPQLEELLADEAERFFLERICELGRELCDSSGGIWFVDLNRCVGRWEGCVLNFRIVYGENFSIKCSASRLSRKNPKQPVIDTYEASALPIFSWIRGVISTALAEQ
ncbi:hypothetical protein D9758_008900 [Tetrapyrgos nigripes]|uniref:Mediator of RNA polymerase II transcription subunit 17 n=1 Tax=Tetrapyrgos nigripes TaxID=182062 RepID=A0A8H5CLQ4_9AGAR|nr:hypothetical protein D9758_008900 [Tetrapyrgos nigripes]